MQTASPLDTYQERHARHGKIIAALEHKDLVLANTRLGLFTAAVITAIAAPLTHAYSWTWCGVPAFGFVILVVWHAKALNALQDARRRQTYYTHGLKRLVHEIAPGAADGSAYANAEHPYAGDLDLFGADGLFPYICTARSRAGEATLAGWLMAPATVPAIASRQRMVEELRSHIDLREDLACLGEDMRLNVHPKSIIAWSEGTRVLQNTSWRAALFVCNAALVACAVAWNQIDRVGAIPFLVTVCVGWGITRVLRDRVGVVMAALEQPSREFAVVAQVIERLQKETFEGPDLQALQSKLAPAGQSAARSLKRLGTLTDLYDAQKNQAFSAFAWLALWAPHFAFAVEAWRAEHGRHVRGWLDALGELEALASLSCYAFEHPNDVFAEIVEGTPRLVGESLAHPLLPPGEVVANSITLDAQHPLLMVSGSNMSGKSTFLRTVGVNAVLALAGAPVRAKRLTLTPLAVGATLRIQDSLQRGTSRFYAEIRRLQQLLEIAQGELPMLFLLDEVLAGTNSHDRAIGASAVIGSYLRKHALGLVTTHDLALAQAESSWRHQAVNVHFVDDLLDGRLHFDYQMRPGVVQHSNALALMRSMGLYQDDKAL